MTSFLFIFWKNEWPLKICILSPNIKKNESLQVELKNSGHPTKQQISHDEKIMIEAPSSLLILLTFDHFRLLGYCGGKVNPRSAFPVGKLGSSFSILLVI